MPGYRGRGFPGKVHVATELNVATAGGLKLAGAAVTSTAPELNLLDSSAPTTTEGVWVQTSRWAKCEYDFATDGGTVGSKTLSVTLPDNAVIMGGFFTVGTVGVASSGSATIALGVVGSNDLFLPATAKSAFATPGQAGALSAAAGAPVKLGAAVAMNLTIAVEALSAGKVNVWVQYVIGD